MGYNYNIIMLMPKVVWDIDALSFISAASITDYSQKVSINTLVVALKNNGVWSKLWALYPFIGGNATSHMYNLKNPLNTDAAFRLTFSGTITHDANGVTFSLTDGWANTHIIPSVNITNNRECFFLYSRSSFATATLNEVDMGCAISTTQRDSLTLRSSGNGTGASFNSTTLGGVISASNTDARGFYMASRETSTSFSLYRNGSPMATTNTSLNNGTRSNIKIYLGCRNVTNVAQAFTGRNFAMAGISAELTSTQAVSMYTAVQNFQTSLGRQV